MVGDIISRILSGGADILDKVVTTQEEKMQLFNELEELNQRDRESARDMYKDDSMLQKIYGLSFLVGYLSLVGFLIYQSFNTDIIEIPEFASNLIFSIFGAMTIKIGTVTDFLFGGSKIAETSERKRKER